MRGHQGKVALDLVEDRRPVGYIIPRGVPPPKEMINEDFQKAVIQYKRLRRPEQGSREGRVLSMGVGSEISRHWDWIDMNPESASYHLHEPGQVTTSKNSSLLTYKVEVIILVTSSSVTSPIALENGVATVNKLSALPAPMGASHIVVEGETRQYMVKSLTHCLEHSKACSKARGWHEHEEGLQGAGGMLTQDLGCWLFPFFPFFLFFHSCSL